MNPLVLTMEGKPVSYALAIRACLEKLKAQTKDKSGTVNLCGRQIWDLIRTNEGFAEIVNADLDNPQMTVAMCERKIREEAKKRGGAVGPGRAENIIRKFYGLPEIPERDEWPEEDDLPEPAKRKEAEADIISLEDFL